VDFGVKKQRFAPRDKHDAIARGEDIIWKAKGLLAQWDKGTFIERGTPFRRAGLSVVRVGMRGRKKN